MREPRRGEPAASRPRHWSDAPRDGLFELLAPILRTDDEYVDRFPDAVRMPAIDETLEFRCDDGTPTWWPTSDDIRRNECLSGLGRDAGWRDEQQRRDVLYEHLRGRLPHTLASPQTYEERQRVVDALRFVHAGLRGRSSGWLI